MPVLKILGASTSRILSGSFFCGENADRPRYLRRIAFCCTSSESHLLSRLFLSSLFRPSHHDDASVRHLPLSASPNYCRYCSIYFTALTCTTVLLPTLSLKGILSPHLSVEASVVYESVDIERRPTTVALLSLLKTVYRSIAQSDRLRSSVSAAYLLSIAKVSCSSAFYFCRASSSLSDFFLSGCV